MTFEAKWRMTLDDHRVFRAAARKFDSKDRWAIPLVIAGVVFFCGVGVFGFFTGSTDALWYVVMAAVWVLLIFLRYKRSGTQQFRSQELGANEYTLSADETHLSVKHGGTTECHEWKSLKRVSDHSEHVIAWTTDVTAHVIPKRAFVNLAESKKFLKLAQEKVNG